MNIDKFDIGLEQAGRRDIASKTGGSENKRTPATPPASGQSELTLSDTARSLALASGKNEASQVDSARVESIRKAISDGTYHVDAARLAERFLSLESSLDQ
ncbi:MAG: flagellar biosynthesis anti-sigma factor FlgM [Pseudomonadota bacterium]